MANPFIYAVTDQRWVSAAAAYNAIWMDVNNGAGGSAVGLSTSRLLKLTNNTVEQFGVGLSGNIVQTIASANVSAIVSTGYSVTGSGTTSMVDLAGTINTSGAVDWVALRATVTSGASAKLLNIYGGASGTTSLVSINAAGALSITGTTVTASAPIQNNTQTWNNGAVSFIGKLNTFTVTAAEGTLSFMEKWVNDSGNFSAIGRYGQLFSNVGLKIGGAGPYASDGIYIGISGMQTASSRYVAWSSTQDTQGTLDLYLTRGAAAATLQMGLADAASPVAQTFQVQSVVAGTSNTAGADWTFVASKSTGTGVGGSFLFKTAAAGGSGTTQNTAATVFAITGTGNVLMGVTTAVALGGSLTPTFQINATGPAASIGAIRYTPGGGGAQFVMASTRAALGSGAGTALVLNDGIGTISFQGADGTNFVNNSAYIRCLVDDTVSAGVMPTRFEFLLTNAVGTNITPVKLDSKKNVILNANGVALGTTDTAGYTYLPTCAGAPTGVPTVAPTGAAPFVYDTTNNKLWAYNGAWRGIVLV